MGKKPLSEIQVKSLRKLVAGNPLHELLLNLSVDLMLRGSDLLKRWNRRRPRGIHCCCPCRRNPSMPSKSTLTEDLKRISFSKDRNPITRTNRFLSFSIQGLWNDGWKCWELKILFPSQVTQWERPRQQSSTTKRRILMLWGDCSDSHPWLPRVPTLVSRTTLHWNLPVTSMSRGNPVLPDFLITVNNR